MTTCCCSIIALLPPYNSLLELGRYAVVEEVIRNRFCQFVGDTWEYMCRQYVSGNIVGGITYKAASRWWGKVQTATGENEMVELDVVAESLDKKHILIGECKWTQQEDPNRLLHRLQSVTPLLPFVKKGQQVHYALFLKHTPTDVYAGDVIICTPTDVLCGE